MSEATLLTLIEDAVGEQEAQHLIVCEIGSIQATYDHLVTTGVIDEGEAE